MQIETQLAKLKLHGMGRVWKSLEETRKQDQLSLAEGLELMLQAEEEDRDNRRFERLRKNAKFRYQATIEQLSLDASRGADPSLISGLATGGYIAKGESVLITGATGCGKSYLASALGHQACAQGFKVAYYNTQKLLLTTKMARLEGSILKFQEKMAKMDLLVLDDFGLNYLEQQQRLDIMELIEDRHARASTIIASQLPVSSWYDIIGEETIADAILDRLIHTAHRIELKGESLRRKNQ